jgi:hypothetical protein
VHLFLLLPQAKWQAWQDPGIQQLVKRRTKLCACAGQFVLFLETKRRQTSCQRENCMENDKALNTVLIFKMF